MMCAVRMGRDSDVGAALPNPHIAQAPEGPLELGAADIARQPHATKISSRTKWRRINPGRSMVSSK